jgi:hypothetical protein
VKLFGHDTDPNDDNVPTEQDVAEDTSVAQSRATGGDPDSNERDATSTTGTGDSGEYVGRVGGQDVGYAGLTGAEARAMDGDTKTPTSDGGTATPGSDR